MPKDHVRKTHMGKFYEVTDILLGKGSFSKVYLARHKVFGNMVALKVIDMDKIEEEYVSKNLSREATILKKLKHPNIVNFYEEFQHDHLYCLSMELVDGHDLSHFLNKQTSRKVSEKFAKMLFYQMVSAINYMHKAHVLHRDLKQENILLEYGRVIKIVDFGLSNIYYPHTKLRTHCGSLEYAAPELFVPGSIYGSGVDLWSLGVILYSMVIGKMPFVVYKEDNDPHSNSHKEKFKRRISQGLITENWKQMKDISSDCSHLLKCLLQPNKWKRILIREVYVHPWLQKDRDLKRNLPQHRPDLQRRFKPEIMDWMSDKLHLSLNRVQNHLAAFTFDKLSAIYYIMQDVLIKEVLYHPENMRNSFLFRINQRRGTAAYDTYGYYDDDLLRVGLYEAPESPGFKADLPPHTLAIKDAKDSSRLRQKRDGGLLSKSREESGTRNVVDVRSPVEDEDESLRAEFDKVPASQGFKADPPPHILVTKDASGSSRMRQKIDRGLLIKPKDGDTTRNVVDVCNRVRDNDRLSILVTNDTHSSSRMRRKEGSSLWLNSREESVSRNVVDIRNRVGGDDDSPGAGLYEASASQGSKADPPPPLHILSKKDPISSRRIRQKDDGALLLKPRESEIRNVVDVKNCVGDGCHLDKRSNEKSSVLKSNQAFSKQEGNRVVVKDTLKSSEPLKDQPSTVVNKPISSYKHNRPPKPKGVLRSTPTLQTISRDSVEAASIGLDKVCEEKHNDPVDANKKSDHESVSSVILSYERNLKFLNEKYGIKTKQLSKPMKPDNKTGVQLKREWKRKPLYGKYVPKDASINSNEIKDYRHPINTNGRGYTTTGNYLKHNSVIDSKDSYHQTSRIYANSKTREYSGASKPTEQIPAGKNYPKHISSAQNQQHKKIYESLNRNIDAACYPDNKGLCYVRRHPLSVPIQQNPQYANELTRKPKVTFARENKKAI